MQLCKRTIQKYGHWIFFAVIILITVYMDVYIAANILDGDASDFMNRARVMAEQKNPFTRDYYLTTELRLLDIAAVFSIFMPFVSDWVAVRVLGSLVMQAYYVLSFLYLCRQTGVSRPASVYAAGMLLVPFSAQYARIVLYHLHYILYLANAFWIMGLTARMLKVRQMPVRKQLLPGILLACIWFYVGLNGIRHMMVVGLPLLLFAAIQLALALRHYTWEDGRIAGREPIMKNEAVHLLMIVMGSFICYGVGFVIGSAVLQPYFKAQDMSAGFFIPAWDANHYSEVLNGWLLASGIRISELPIVGIRGLSMAACLFGFGYLLVVSLKSCFEEKSLGVKMMHGILGFSFVTTTLIFCLEFSIRVHELYYVPVAAMAACAMAQEFSNFRDRSLSVCRRLLVLITCVCFLFQGAYTVYFLRVEKDQMDSWSALYVFRRLDAVERLNDCVDYMEDNGYTYALIEYWYANPMIEMSDGKLRVGGLGGYNAKDQTVSLYH